MAGLAVNAVVLNQNGVDLYLFAMSSEDLQRLSYVTPRSKDDPNEIQRVLDPRRAKAIGEYVKQASSLLPNSLVVSLTDDVTVADTENPKVKVITFPDHEGKFAYILDGQHRLGGFAYSEGVHFDLAIVALHRADEALRVKIFADINSKQVPVSKVTLLSLYHQIKALDADDTPVLDVITRLNTDTDSPLKDKIKIRDDQTDTWIRNVGLKRWLAPHVTSGGKLASKSVPDKAQIIKEYLKAIRQTWPVAWDDRKNYNLTSPIGFEMLLSVFPNVLHRVDLNAGKQYTAANIAKQMEVLREVTIEMPDGGKLDLDWLRGTMGAFASAGTRVVLTRRLTDVLTEADQ